MTDVVMNYLVKAQDLIPAEYGNYALVSAITVVGLAKAAGTMAHPGSKMVGKLELVGAILLLMGPASLGGFGHIFASWSILVAMGMMLAIKPRAILTEATLITLSSKILRSEWGNVTHDSMTQGMSWETAMGASIMTGFVIGTLTMLSDRFAPNKAGAKATPNKAGNVKRTKRV